MIVEVGGRRLWRIFFHGGVFYKSQIFRCFWDGSDRTSDRTSDADDGGGVVKGDGR